MANKITTIGTEYFYAIPGLSIPKYEISVTLNRDIEFMIDWIPKNADLLRFLLDYHQETFILQMQVLHDMLNYVYARWLANDAAKILQVAKIMKIETCHKLLTPFIAKIHMLAIDMQMTQKNAEGFEETNNDSRGSGKYEGYEELERYRDVVNSMKIISDLLENDSDDIDFEKISDIAANIGELKEDSTAIPLFTCIALKRARTIKSMAQKITAQYLEKINALNLSATASSKMKKIAIVDDMADVLTALTLMLEGHYQVIPLSDGTETLALIDAGHVPDAFILDIDMPEMDGFTLAKNIRKRKHFTQTPILFLTGNSTKETVIKAFQCNAKTFIVKPASKDIIISRLSSCF